MQSRFTDRRWSWRSCLALTCMLAMLVVGAVQVAHWCGQPSPNTTAQAAQPSDGLCPICFSVPVGHSAASAMFTPVCLGSVVAEFAGSPQSA